MAHEKANTNVYVDYFEGLRRWIIIDADTNEAVKGYDNEADAMFDYSALRNGEVTIADVQNNCIRVGDRVHSVALPSTKGTVVKAEKGSITVKMDNRAHESTTWSGSASSYVKIEG